MKRYRSTLRIPLLDRSRPTGEGREEGKGKEESEGGGEGARVFRATKHNAITRSVNMRHQLCLGLFERKFCSPLCRWYNSSEFPLPVCAQF